MKLMISAFEDRDVEVYMDNAATTIMSEEVIAEMLPYLEERYGNPETHYHLEDVGTLLTELIDQ